MDATITKDETTALTGFSREAVEELSRRKGEPDWVREARLAAWETYERLPMPQRTDEEWRRTDLRGLKLDRLVPFAVPNGKADSAVLQSVGSLDGDNLGGVADRNAGIVVQRDATIAHVELDPEVAAEGVIFTDLGTAVSRSVKITPWAASAGSSSAWTVAASRWTAAPARWTVGPRPPSPAGSSPSRPAPCRSSPAKGTWRSSLRARRSVRRHSSSVRCGIGSRS